MIRHHMRKTQRKYTQNTQIQIDLDAFFASEVQWEQGLCQHVEDAETIPKAYQTSHFDFR